MFFSSLTFILFYLPFYLFASSTENLIFPPTINVLCMLMLNRTTKPAPHLDSVHVVFGLVISGFEVIEQIENLKTDSASRPYADVRVIDCGVLVTKPAKEGKPFFHGRHASWQKGS
uniref:PPIase cyclophilin-type domain-containing protein n=1 Tax=Micrurus lemniscatus lemniscatus TaxID=129467 RepID=A0A2D4J5G6_MICLE